MTAPVQEPSLPRNFQGTAWATRQLARRPPPASTDERAWARVSKPFPDGTFYPNQTIINNSNVTLDFDEAYNMDPGDSGADYFSTVGTPINTLRIEVQGLYAVTAEMEWTTAASFPWYASISGDGMNWPHRTHTGYFDTSGAELAEGSFSFIHRYEANDDLELHVYQRSGGNRTLEAFYLEAVYLGSWTGIALDDMLPVQ